MMKFTDALILFCSLTAGSGFVAMFFSTPPVQVVHGIFWLGIGVFSCWWQTKPRSAFFGRLGRFFKIPRCWVESKEASK
ncbi:MAG: hypothetical protein ACTFAL_10630 [Candidatus Electronema sp. V4]|uniref:hypothetical protein n=1 Tax=Candidatus Electronema sp. V4 TaxID=3454756 RepID=UPI0040555829